MLRKDLKETSQNEDGRNNHNGAKAFYEPYMTALYQAF